MKRKQRKIGAPWFRPTDYGEVRRLCPELPLSFAEWRKGARRVVEAATAQGVHAVQIYISAPELLAFAKQRRAPFIGSEVLIDWCQERIGDAMQPPTGDIQERFRREIARTLAGSEQFEK